MSNMYNKKFNKSVIALMIVITIAKIIGMLRDSVLAYYFGTSNISDAYIIAMSVPMLLFYFIGHGISTSFLPMYTHISNSDGEDEAKKYTSNIINISLLFSLIIITLLIIFPDSIIKLFAMGFDKATLNISSNFVRISAISLVFIVFIDIYGVYLNIKGKFVIPALRSVFRNVVIVLSIYLAYKYNLNYLGYGIIAAYLAELLFILIFAIKAKIKYTFSMNFKDSNVRKTFYLVAPIVLTTGISQINKIIDKSIASTIAVGGVSALNYASVINNAVQEILITGLIAVLFANFADLAAKGNIEEIRLGLNKTLNIFIFFLIPATAGIILLSEDIVRIFFLRGAFDNTSLKMTTYSLIFYSIGLFFIATKSVFIKVYYAFNMTKIPTVIAILSICVNIILNIILSRFMGIPGLALATSISAIANSVLLYFLLSKKISNIVSTRTILIAIKTIISVTGMIISVIMVSNIDFGSMNLYLISLLKMLSGLMVFILLSFITKNEVLFDLFNSLKKGSR